MRKGTFLLTFCALAMVAGSRPGPGVRAQGQEKREESNTGTIKPQSLILQKSILADPSASGIDSIERVTPLLQSGMPGDSFMSIASEMNYVGNPIKGVPFSADARTEFVQVLADGNRIVRTTTGSLYRDSEGRTRREQVHIPLGLGAPTDNPEMYRVVTIYDPVSNQNYTLQPHARTAFKYQRIMPQAGANTFYFQAQSTGAGAKAAGTAPKDRPLTGAAPIFPDSVKAEKETNQVVAGRTFGSAVINSDGSAPAPANAPKLTAVATALPPMAIASIGGSFNGSANGEIKQESLGRQTIEGVEAEGSRIVYTIPAGAIGNERLIEVAFERWFSPELRLVIMARHTDPRAGETVYRLTNINRSHQDPSLFEIPEGYTVNEPLKAFAPNEAEPRKNDK